MCLQCPLCEEMWLPWLWVLPWTAIPPYLLVTSALAPGLLPRAVLLRFSSAPFSAWRRGSVSDPGSAGPVAQLSDTSWASEETAGWPDAGGRGGGSGGGGGAAEGGGGTMSLLGSSASSVSEITMEGCSGSGFSAFTSNLLAVAPEGEAAAPSGAVRGADCFPGFFLPLGVPDVPDLLEVSLEALGWDEVDEGDGEEDLEPGGFFAWEELAKTRKKKAFYSLAIIWFCTILSAWIDGHWYFQKLHLIILQSFIHTLETNVAVQISPEVGKTETMNIAREQWRGSTWEVGESLIQHSALAPYFPELYWKNLLLIPELFNALLKNIASRQRKWPDFSYLLWPLLFLSTKRTPWFSLCFSVKTLGLRHRPVTFHNVQ